VSNKGVLYKLAGMQVLQMTCDELLTLIAICVDVALL
jgi:hypothetical protein